MTHYKDTSIFQGVKEFSTPAGEYRAMWENQYWGVYELIDGAYIRCATVKGNPNSSCKYIYNAIQNLY